MNSVAIPAEEFSETPITLDLNEFNTALGTLTGVALTISADVTLSPRLFNISGTQSYTYRGATANVDISVTAPGGPATLDSPFTTPQNGTIGPGLLTLGPFAQPGLSNSLTIPSGNWSSYEAAGGPAFTVSLVSLFHDLGSASSQNVFFDGGGTIDRGSLAVTYSYTPIAEPSTYALAVGVAATGWALRRRRRPIP